MGVMAPDLLAAVGACNSLVFTSDRSVVQATEHSSDQS